MGSKKTKTSTTTTPIVPDFIKTPYQNYSTRVQGMFDNPYVQPLNNQEKTAFNFTGSQGTNALKSLLNPSVYENQVVNNSLRDLDRGRQMQITDDQARATAAGAFGGSRHGVADSLTNREFADTAANTASNLRLQGLNFRRDTANQLAQNQRADTGLTSALGEQQRLRLALANNSSPEYMAMMAQLMQGMNGQMFTGQQSNGTQSGGGLGGLFGGLGSLGMGLGGLGWKPFGGGA